MQGSRYFRKKFGYASSFQKRPGLNILLACRVPLTLALIYLSVPMGEGFSPADQWLNGCLVGWIMLPPGSILPSAGQPFGYKTELKGPFQKGPRVTVLRTVATRGPF